MSTGFNAATWTASDLLTDVFTDTSLPDSGTIDWTPQKVLSLASDAIHDWAGSLIQGAGQGRAVTTLTRSITTDATDARGMVYELPPMAMADAIDAVTWLTSTGDQERRLETIPRAMEAIFAQPSSNGCPEVYALEDGTIRVLPRPTQAGSLRIQYRRRHGQLVVGGDTASIVSISSASAGAETVLNLSTVPASYIAGAWIDVFGRYYPHRTKVSARVTLVGGFDVTIAYPYADAVAAGIADDTTSIYGKTPYVQLPLEMRQPLTKHLASRILGVIGDMAKAEAFDGMASAGAARIQGQLSPRVKSTPQKVFNPRSLARSGVRKRWPGDWH